jgi:hypothetical protein
MPAGRIVLVHGSHAIASHLEQQLRSGKPCDLHQRAVGGRVVSTNCSRIVRMSGSSDVSKRL